MRDVTSASRRRILQVAVAVAGATLVRAGVAQDAAEPRVIELTARRFTYTPNEIALKAGERVVIAIRSIDFVHGMNLPDLHMRLDLVPGRIFRSGKFIPCTKSIDRIAITTLSPAFSAIS